ncbi:hypothetical protein [Breoghania sp.]|uniref:hypothetical protein n=1 Tax=Breoghania sp. TaxID=2065378 RepID=UPI002628704D|nr:hypothetical protein [Breoghania sp.]MDJ0933568.1 hypothetical protein [Breoghania sp.]
MRAVSVGTDDEFFGQAGSYTSKDSFRKGASLDNTLARYQRFVDLIAGPPIRRPLPIFAEVVWQQVEASSPEPEGPSKYKNGRVPC